MLIWCFDLIKKAGISDDDFPQVLFSRCYQDGKPVKMDKDQKQLFFLSYLSLFPAKEVVKIKLGVEGLTTYSAYYLAKKYFDKKILGVINIQEYESKHDFEWKSDEMLVNLFLEAFNRFFLQNKIGTEEEFKATLKKFTELMDKGAEYNYMQWKKAKEQWIDDDSDKKREKLADMFIKSIKTKESEEKNEQQSSKKQLVEVEPKHKGFKVYSLEESDYDYKYFTKNELNDLLVRWDFQLINDFGNPLCKIMKFENGEQVPWGSYEEQNRQTLESMAYSVLQTLVTEKMKIKHMIFELPENQGRTILMFQSFKMKDHNFQILMNIENYNPITDTYIGKWEGTERALVEKIAKELEKHEEWFEKDGALSCQSVSKEIEMLFYRECRKVFKNVV